MSTLIVPCAGRSSRFPGLRPKWLLTHPDGQLMIQKSLSGIDLSDFDRVILTIVKEHAEKFDAELILEKIFEGTKAEIFVLDDFTSSAAETVYLTLKDNNVKGSFIIKDSDNFVGFERPESVGNFVVGLDLNKFGDVSNITGKSFLILNEQNLLIDIIEKKVRSNVICLGVYAVKDVELFNRAYLTIVEQNSSPGELFVSHVLSYLISQENQIFHYVEASGFEDWGTLTDWRRMTEKHQSYFVDIDGVLLKNTGKYGQVNWSNNRKVLEKNIACIKNLQEQGGQIILVTSRSEDFRPMITEIMQEQGIKFHALIMGCHHARRVMINDFAPSNPYPSCVAVNVPRDGDIDDYL